MPQLDQSEAEKDKEAKEIVIRAQPNQQITQILQQYNISLAAGAKGISSNAQEKTQTEEKTGETKKFVVTRKTDALFLQENRFRTITGLSKVLDGVMWRKQDLLWLDLSYNLLERVEEEIVQNFSQLRVLYLHGNYILNLEEVRKLN